MKYLARLSDCIIIHPCCLITVKIRYRISCQPCFIISSDICNNKFFSIYLLFSLQYVIQWINNCFLYS